MNDVKITEAGNGYLRLAGSLAGYLTPREVAALREHFAAEQKCEHGIPFIDLCIAAQYDAEQPATPTPSTEQIRAERDLFLAAIKEALRIPERHEATPISETVRRHAYLVGRQVAVDEFRSILEAALASPVSEQPTPLDPEPWGSNTGVRFASDNNIWHDRTFAPRPGFEQAREAYSRARYEQGG